MFYAGQKSRTAVVQGLTPNTTYAITVKARDLYGPNVSAPSNVATVTTTAAGGADTAPPSSPGNLYGWDVGDGAKRNKSVLDSLPRQPDPSLILYEVYLNGVLDHTLVGVDPEPSCMPHTVAKTFSALSRWTAPVTGLRLRVSQLSVNHSSS